MKKVLGLLRNVALVIVLLAIVGAFMGGGDDSEKADTSSSTAAEEQVAEEQTSDEEEKAEEKKSEKKKSEKQKAEKAEEKEEEPAAEEEASDGPSIAKNAKYGVSINSSRIVEDYDGAPCIAIDYTFTNISDDDPTSMQLATDISVYQNGVECEEAWFADSNSDGYSNKVKAGVSVDVTRAYKLQDTSSDVEVEVGQLFSWSDDLLAYAVIELS